MQPWKRYGTRVRFPPPPLIELATRVASSFCCASPPSSPTIFNRMSLIFSRLAVSTSLFSRNEPGNAGLYNGVKPDPRLDSFANLPHGVFGKGGDVKVLLDAARRFRGGQQGRPALDAPG